MAQVGFEGQAVIVTGAGRGLGRSHALALAQRGARVVVNDLRGSADYGEEAGHSAADDVVAEIRAAGGEAIACTDGVGTPEGCKALVAATLEAYGSVDAIIHNAGLRRHFAYGDLTLEDISLVVDIHLGGGIWLTHAAWPHMQQQGYGRIVLTSSASGAFGMNCGANYAAAKAGLIGLTRTLAQEGAEYGIQANALLPAADTNLRAARGRIPAKGAVGSGDGAALPDNFGPDLVSPMAVYLASRACQDNGALYSAVGGRFARAFTGVTQGWFGPYERPATPEEIIEHLDEINDQTDFWVPETVGVEVRTVLREREERTTAAG